MYGIDLEDEQLLASRSFRWLVARIKGLLNTPGARIFYALADD